MGHKASLSLGRRPPAPTANPSRCGPRERGRQRQSSTRFKRGAPPAGSRPVHGPEAPRPEVLLAPRTVLPPLGAALVPGAPSSFSRKHATSLTWGVGQEPGLRPRVWGARCSDSQREAAWPPHLSSSRLQHGNGLVAHRASRAGGCRAGVPRRRGAAGRGAWRTPPHPGGAAGLPSRSSCCPHVPTLRLLRKGKGEAASA